MDNSIYGQLSISRTLPDISKYRVMSKDIIWAIPEHIFLCPRHKMAEGHIEFTLSVCVFVCLCIPESCPGHNLAVHDGI